MGNKLEPFLNGSAKGKEKKRHEQERKMEKEKENILIHDYCQHGTSSQT